MNFRPDHQIGKKKTSTSILASTLIGGAGFARRLCGLHSLVPGNWGVFRKKLYARQEKQLNPIDFIDDGKRGAIPIYLRMGVEYDAVVNDVVQQIKDLSNMLKERENPD